MNMRIRANNLEEENKKLHKKILIWQNTAVVSIVGNAILVTIISVIIS